MQEELIFELAGLLVEIDSHYKYNPKQAHPGKYLLNRIKEKVNIAQPEWAPKNLREALRDPEASLDPSDRITPASKEEILSKFKEFHNWYDQYGTSTEEFLQAFKDDQLSKLTRLVNSRAPSILIEAQKFVVENIELHPIVQFLKADVYWNNMRSRQ